MSTLTLNDEIPTDEEIRTLRQQVEDSRKLQQYNDLKRSLAKQIEMTHQERQEAEGGLQSIDIDKSLKQKRERPVLFEKIAERFRKMIAWSPITGNIISLILIALVIQIAHMNLQIPHFETYRHYIIIATLLVAAYQIISSSMRSLFLPLIFLTFGLISLHYPEMKIMAEHWTLVPHVLSCLILVSMIATIVSAFSIN